MHRLWDHLGSNLSLYVQPLELHPDGVAKTKPAAEDQGGKTESHPIESDAHRGNNIKTHGHHNNRENKELMKERDEIEVPLPQNSVAEKVKTRDAPRPRDSHRTPRSSIHKKRRRIEDQQPRQVIAPHSLYVFGINSCLLFVLHGQSFCSFLFEMWI